MTALLAAFKALGDPVRLRLFALLGHSEELCVCHLVDALELPQSTVSRHLSVLRHAGLVSTRRDGKWMHYRLQGDVAQQLLGLIQQHNAIQIKQDEASLQRVMN